MIGFQSVMEAWLECRSNKRYSAAALAFEAELEDNLLGLWRELNEGSYRIGPAIAFVVEHPVKREVFAADFRDRVVHHLLMKRLIPHFEREFIFDSYACRPGKGTLFGVRRIRRFISRCSEGYTRDCYILKCDVSGFFMNIDRRELWRMLERFIERQEVEDKEIVMQLTEMVVMHDPTVGCRINGSVKRWRGVPESKSLFGTNGKAMPGSQARQLSLEFPAEKGLPIGNLTSQWFGNFYLNRFDHYVKSELGVRYYGRYVDDFVIVHEDREYLKELVPKLEAFLREKLHLELHPRKRYLQHYSKGVTFLGVKIKGGAMLPGKRTKGGLYGTIERWNAAAAKRTLTGEELKAFRDSVNSYWGITRHQSGYGLRKRSAQHFSARIRSRVSYAGYRKVTLRDYSVLGNRAVPYYEFEQLKRHNITSKNNKKRKR